MVALSGGADSAVLALAALDAGITVRALHVHHGQAASDQLEQAARAVAGVLDMPIETLPVTVPDTGSFESEARRVRYRALLGALNDDEVLLVGHTADDQAETLLLRLARGSGPSGLAGMRQERGSVIRPLLAWRRAELRDLAERASLPYMDDPANLDHRHSRVVVREQIIPLLERIQPGATDSISRHARLAAAVEDDLATRASAALTGCRLSVAMYRSLDELLRVHALRALALRAGRMVPGTDALDRMHEVAIGQASSTQVDDGFELIRVGSHVELIRSCQVPPPRAELGPGPSTWGGWRFVMRSGSGRPPAWPLHAGRAVVPAEGRVTVRPLRATDVRGSRRIIDDLRGLPAHAAMLARSRAGRRAGVGSAGAATRGRFDRAPGRPLPLAQRRPEGPVDVGEVLISADDIEAKLAEMGAAITEDYQGRNLLMVGVLKGAFIVMADLARHVQLPVEFDFMAVSSYGAATQTSGVVRILKDLDQEIAERDILIVEDIIDSGLTLNYLLKSLRVRKPASLEVAALLVKKGIQRVPLEVRYTGFEIGPEFVIGYGLDYAGKYRNLPYVGVLEGDQGFA